MKIGFLTIRFHREMVFIFIASLVAITFADVVERFGFAPCKLCYYQRYIYWSLVALTAFTMLFRRKLVFFLVTFALLISEFVLSFFHMGVEKGWFKYQSTCTTDGTLAPTDDITSILSQPVVPCDDPQIVVYGLSMAGWNAVYALVITIIFLYLSYADKKS